uniref:Lipocalin/cytosolic fatty-acid binding domain-containing protein n=1 Tax=Homalodisca liturata TaxID=320908 RepID=A0A1B6K0I1_9HEMI
MTNQTARNLTRFSRMLWVAILLLGASLVSALIDNIGPCDVTVITEGNFSLEQFSTENNGIWTYVKVPSTESTEYLESMIYTITPTECYGQYHVIMYYKNYGDQEYKLFTDEDAFDSTNGHVTSITRGEPRIVLRVYFLKYVPGIYIYYYICSDEGGEKKVDYRYVMAHGPLSDDDKSDIQCLEEQFQFSGVLKDI